MKSLRAVSVCIGVAYAKQLLALHKYIIHAVKDGIPVRHLIAVPMVADEKLLILETFVRLFAAFYSFLDRKIIQRQ